MRECLKKIDVETLTKELRDEMRETSSDAKKKKLARRLRVVDAFKVSSVKPEWMILDIIPVLPPELRPLVPWMAGGLPHLTSMIFTGGLLTGTTGSKDLWN